MPDPTQPKTLTSEQIRQRKEARDILRRELDAARLSQRVVASARSGTYDHSHAATKDLADAADRAVTKLSAELRHFDSETEKWYEKHGYTPTVVSRHSAR